MKQSSLFIISFCILSLSSTILADNLKLTINEKQDLPQTESHLSYTIDLSSYTFKETDKYLIITTIPLLYLNPASIYLSFDNETPSNTDNYINSQTLGENSLYIPINSIQSNKTIYLGIFCESNCNGNINAYTTEKIMLTNHKSLSLNPFEETINIYYKHISKDGFVSLTAYGENAELFDMVASYSGNKGSILRGNKLLDNGYALLINVATYEPEDDQDNFFIVSLNTKLIESDQYPFNRKITLKIDELSSEPIPFNLLDNIYGYTDTKSVEQICYLLEENELTNIEDETYILYINSYTQSVKVKLFHSNKNETGLERRSFFNNYIIIDNSMFSLKESTFCFSRSSPLINSTGNTDQHLSFSFQLVPISFIKQSIHQTRIPPLVNGVNYIQYLPYNSLMLYRHSSFSNSLSLTTHLKTISGKPILYGYKCTNYPYCSFKFDTFHESIEDFISNRDIALEYTIQSSDVLDEKYLDNHIQFLSIVTCESEDLSPCSYIIETNHLFERIELLPYETFSQGIDERYPKNFMIRLHDMDIFEALKIELTSITGNIELGIDEFLELSDTKIEQHYNSSNHKEIYTFTKNDLEKLNIKMLNLTVSSNSMGYFSIRYYFTKIQSKIHLEPNIIHIERITKEDGEKVMGFLHKSKQNKFQIIIKSFGCDINILFNETNISNTAHYHNIILPENANDIYYYTISTTSSECSCYLIGNEINNENELELVLTEGSIHSFKMNSDIPHLAFSYPLMYMNSYESVILQIDMKKYTKLDVSIGVNQETRPFTKYTIYKSSTFIIKDIMNDKCTFGTLCAVIILIDYDDKEEIEFDVILKNNQKVPVYLEQSQTRSDKIYPGDMQYFYSDLNYNKGEVVIHFTKGNGNAYGKIIRKDIFETNSNWLNRVILPSGNTEVDYNKEGVEIVGYDPLMERIVFDLNEDNWKCGKEHQCEIYIGITNEDMFISEEATPLGEYLIYMSDKEKSDTIKGISFELGEQVFGNLKMGNESEYQCNYYSLNVIESITRILISFKHNCTDEDECSLYINKGYNNYASPSNYEYKYEIDENVFSFTNETNNHFSISVCQKQTLVHNNYFQFSFIPQYTEETNINIHKINMGESIQCTFTYTSENEGCHIILDKPFYEKIYSFSLNVFEKGQTTKFDMCYQEIQTSTIDSAIYSNRDELANMIIPQRNSCIEGINEYYFKGAIDSLNKDNMHIMSFYLNEPKEIGSIVTITVQISFYVATEVLTLKPTQRDYLFQFDEVKEVHLNIITNNNSPSFFIKTQNNIDTYIEYNSYSIPTNNNTLINIYNKQSYKDLIIKSEEMTAFNFELFPQNNRPNILYVELNKNTFYFEHDNTFPQQFYIKLEQNMPIYLNTKFIMNSNAFLIDGKFKISGHLVKEIEGNDMVALNDDIIKTRIFSNKVGLINMNPHNGDMKYLCINIENLNDILYESILTNIFLNKYVFGEPNRIMLLYDEYYYAVFTETIVYEIPTSDEGSCIIEIAEGAYNLTSQSINVVPFYLNYSIHSIDNNDNINIAELNSKIGARTIQVNSTNKQSLLLEISKNQKANYILPELEYIIKYYYTPKSFSYNNTIQYEYDSNKNNLLLTFDPIATSQTDGTYLNTKYKIQLINQYHMQPKQTYLETICPNIENKELNSTFTTYFDFSDLNETNNTFSISFDLSSVLSSLGKSMYLILSSEYQEEIFMYSLLTLSLQLPETKTGEAPYSTVFIVILIIFIILTLLIGIFFYNRHIKFVKINSDMEIDANIDNSTPIASIN